MNKGDLIENVADKAGLSKADATRALDEIIKAVTKALKKGDQVVFMSNGGFGASRQKLTMALQKRRTPPA